MEFSQPQTVSTAAPNVKPAAPPTPRKQPRAVLGRAAKPLRLIRDPFRLAIVLLLVETLAKFTGLIPVLSNLRLAFIVFLFCLFYAVANRKKALDLRTFKFRVPQLVLAQFVLAGFSTVFGISQGSSAHFVMDVYWKTIAFALLLMGSLRGTADTRWVIKGAALAGIILAFVSVFVVHVSKEAGTGTYDANDIGTIVVMSLPLVILVMQTSKGIWRLISLAGVGLIGITIPMTASRGAFIGLVAVGVGMLFFLPGVSAFMRVVAVGAVAIVLLVFAPSSYWDSMRKTLFDPTSDYNWDAGQGRKALAQRGIQYMMRYPIFGIGIGNFGHAEEDPEMSEYAAQQIERHAGFRASAPHNSWVQAGAETGIPGIALWVALIVGSAWGVVKMRRTMPEEWLKTGTPDQRFVYLAACYVPIAILGFAVAGTFVSFAWNDQSYVLPAIALGLQKACAEQLATASSQPSGLRRGAGGRQRRPMMRRLQAPKPAAQQQLPAASQEAPAQTEPEPTTLA